MPASYPDETALADFLSGLPLPGMAEAAAALDLAGFAAAAADQWEDETGWFPFLADGADSARVFDPPSDSRLLPLAAGLLSLTSLTVGWTGTGTGTAQTAGRQFRLLPQNADARKRPFDAVEWVNGWFYGYSAAGQGQTLGFGTMANIGNGLAGSIRIVGKWGRQTTLTDDVYQAVLRLGALLAAPSLSALIGGGLVERVAGDERERYSDKGALAVQIGEWQAVGDRAIDRYRRRELIF